MFQEQVTLVVNSLNFLSLFYLYTEKYENQYFLSDHRRSLLWLYTYRGGGQMMTLQRCHLWFTSHTWNEEMLCLVKLDNIALLLRHVILILEKTCNICVSVKQKKYSSVKSINVSYCGNQ